MPKPGRYSKPSWNNHYDYSEQAFRGQSARRVSFKPSRNGPSKKGHGNKDWTASIRSHLEDEDIDMGSNAPTTSGFSRKKYYYKKGGRPGSPVPNKGKRKLLEGPTNWYRVTLPYGNKYDKEYILRTLLQNISPLPFIPITWTVNGTAITFYVDEFKLAEKLFSLDRQIQCPDGFKLIIRVNSGSPHVDITTEMKEKMKLAMSKRFNAATKALDLSKFHADPHLQDVFCALFKPIVLLAAVDIIAENIPELEALSLDDNKIQILGHLRKLSFKLPNLKILHLGKNKIRDISVLDSLIGLPLIELVLDGNPLCDKYKDQTVYISEVRKRFPKVMKLDGINLPPPICFDVSDEARLPDKKQTFLCNSEGQGIVRQFLEAYFTIYDSDSRQPLLQAYHENAIFSLTMAYPYGQHPKNSSWLNWYSTDNRNLLRVLDSERRHKLLRQGQVAVVSYLTEIPSTKHDIHGFTVDLTLFTPQMLLLTVTGMFRELHSGHKVPPLRAFCRTLVIVPAGTGFCIANEELHVTNATDEQAKVAFKTPVVMTEVVPAPVPAQVAPVTVNPVAPVPDDLTKQQMVQAFAQHSRMNLEWSHKCLEETNWDFQRAGFVFTELQKQGTIPSEAFVK